MENLNSFEEFLKKKKEEVEKMAKTNQKASERVAKWKIEIASLYRVIQDWLKPYSDTISIRTIDFMISEELTGSYNVDALALKIGKDEIIFQPRGTYMLGSSGRIDVNGRNKTYILSLIEIDDSRMIEDKWIIVDKIDRMSRKPFSKKNFEELIQALVQ